MKIETRRHKGINYVHVLHTFNTGIKFNNTGTDKVDTVLSGTGWKRERSTGWDWYGSDLVLVCGKTVQVTRRGLKTEKAYEDKKERVLQELEQKWSLNVVEENLKEAVVRMESLKKQDARIDEVKKYEDFEWRWKFDWSKDETVLAHLDRRTQLDALIDSLRKERSQISDKIFEAKRKVMTDYAKKTITDDDVLLDMVLECVNKQEREHSRWS